MSDFALLETMRAEHRVVLLARRHLERLSQSAVRFGFVCDTQAIRDGIENAAREIESPACLRLTLSADGAWELETRAIPERTPHLLTIAPLRVNSADIFLYHKTTNRQTYARARENAPENTDVLLINERGEATETTIANIAVLRNGRWITPPVSCGLLAGVQRAELLANGVIVEGVVEAGSLVAGETVRCFNALRGLFEASIQL